jgi:peptidoglycan/LPS O-acetylase OafA/YrhL
MNLLTNNPISREMSRERVYGLDMLRAYAIILTLIGHAGLLMPVRFQIIQYRYFIFMDAVNLFFVLSGFLIGRILINAFKTEHLNFKALMHFWSRRWLRTLPAYFFVLSMLALLHQVHSKRMLLKFGLFIQNFNTPQPEWFTEAWTLSIEEWFYLLTPLCVFIAIKAFRMPTYKAFLVIACAFIIAFPLYRLYKFYQVAPFDGHRPWEFLFRMQVTTRLDSIMYGVVAACIYCYYRNTWNRYKNISLITGITIIWITRTLDYSFIEQEGIYSNFYSSVFTFSCQCFGAMLILPFFENIKQGKGKLSRFITFISVISYSLYLLNFALVALFIMPRMPHWGLPDKLYYVVRYLATLIVSVGLACILYIAVEHPFLYLRSKLGKKRRGSGAIPLPEGIKEKRSTVETADL